MPKIGKKMSPVATATTSTQTEGSTAAYKAAGAAKMAAQTEPTMPQPNKDGSTAIAKVMPTSALIEANKAQGVEFLKLFFETVKDEDKVRELSLAIDNRKGAAMNVMSVAMFHMMKADKRAYTLATKSFTSNNASSGDINDYFKAGLGFTAQDAKGNWHETPEFQKRFYRIDAKGNPIKEGQTLNGIDIFKRGVTLRNSFSTQMKQALQAAVGFADREGVQAVEVNSQTKRIMLSTDQGEFELAIGRDAETKRKELAAKLGLKEGDEIPPVSLSEFRDIAAAKHGTGSTKPKTKPSATTEPERIASDSTKAGESEGNVDTALLGASNAFLITLRRAGGMTISRETRQVLGEIFNELKRIHAVLNPPPRATDAVRQAQTQAQTAKAAPEAKPEAKVQAKPAQTPQAQAAKQNEPTVTSKTAQGKRRK